MTHENAVTASATPAAVNTCSPRDPQIDEKYFAEYTLGKRISFTVVVHYTDGNGSKCESRYDADHLESVFREGDMEPMLSFISSGRRIQIEAYKVANVEFSKPKPWYWNGQKLWHGTSHCAGCDGQLKHMVKRPQ